MSGVDAISCTGLLVSLLVPWLAGGLMLHLLLPSTVSGRLAICIGCGYLTGLLLTVSLLRAFNLVLPGHLYVPSLSVLLLSILAMTAQGHRQGWRSAYCSTTASLSSLEKLLAILFLALIAIRLGTLFQEVALRPLFPWDALMNWAPKAIVWSHYNELVPFTTADNWLASDHEEPLYTLRAALYPEMVPTVLLWNMLGAGVSDHSLIYLSWPLLLLALVTAVFGFARAFGLRPLPALVAGYLVCSLPFANVHTALAGYADLWMATAFVFATCSAQALVNTRDPRYLALTLLMCLACVMLKRPGVVLAGIVILTLLVCWSRKGPWILLGGTLALLIPMVVGVDVNLPLLGRVSLSTEFISLPFIGELTIEYHDVSARFIETFFLSANWNLLIYLAVPATLMALFQPGAWSGLKVTGLGLMLALFFLYVTYHFTQHYENAENLTALNRALLYVMPLLVVFCAQVAHATTRRLLSTPDDEAALASASIPRAGQSND